VSLTMLMNLNPTDSKEQMMSKTIDHLNFGDVDENYHFLLGHSIIP
jgi:hypothetical protein